MNFDYNEVMDSQPDLETIQIKLRQVLPLLKDRFHVESLGLFGSYLRRQQNPASDLDVLVTFLETPGLLKFLELENFLSDQLGVKVDLVLKDALKPAIGKHILAEVKQI